MPVTDTAPALDPATAPDRDLRGWLNGRWDELDADYAPWKAVHQEIARWVAPQRASFLLSDRTPVDALLNPDILDDTAAFAGDTLSAALTTFVMSSWRTWFMLTTLFPGLNERPKVKAWLNSSSERLGWLALMTNLYTEAPTVFHDQGHFGTAPLIAFRDPERFLRFEVPPAGSYRLGANASRRVDTFMRELWITIGQLVDEFGRDNVSQGVREAFDGGKRGEGRIMRHAILPNPRADRRRAAFARFKPWADIYWEVRGGDGSAESGPVFLRYSGHNRFPVMASRWAVRAGEVWGTGPGFRSLGVIKSLQTMSGDEMDAVAKYIDPPMTGPTSLRGEPMSLLPSGLTLYDETKGAGTFRPAVEQKINLEALEAIIQKAVRAIQRSYHEDLFRLIMSLGRTEMTATQVSALIDEGMPLLAPMFERNSTDLLTPTVEMLFDVAQESGLLDPVPDELDGIPLRVKYLSVMAVRLSAQSGRGLVQFGQEVLEYARLLGQRGPEMTDKVNWSRFTERLADLRGVPPELVVTDIETAQRAAARAQAMRIEATLAAASSAAATARDLSAADMSGDNALTRVAGARPQ